MAGNLIYPSDNIIPHYIIFSIVKNSKGKAPGAGGIMLYVPETMIYDLEQHYEQTTIYNVIGEVLGMVPLLGGIYNSGLQGITSLLKAGQLAGTGATLNPLIAVLYSNPVLRTFQYDFTFAPRSAQEAVTVDEIIKTFRSASAPGELAGSFGLSIPDKFIIEVKSSKSIPRTKECVLENINVDYAPQGQFTTFTDSRPVVTKLRLAFKEIDIITKEDIEKGY